jgi:replicative DNA helicase
MKIEQLILASLIKREDYARKVLAFITPEYFSESSERTLFEMMTKYFQNYNTCPSKAALVIESDSLSLNQKDHEQIRELIDNVDSMESSNDLDWTVDATEKWCKDRAVYNAIFECIKIIDDKEGKQKISKNAIPELLRHALSVSFDTNIGHDYTECLKERYDYYHSGEEKIPFDLSMLNTITDGGVPRKTLSVVAAPTGGGKSIFLCHHAAACLRQNKNVLYITLEMSEQRIAERIDANLTNTRLNELRELPYPMYEKKFKRATQDVQGKLIIKEYPTGTASALNFRHLIDELRIKKNFAPDVVIVDYLNICSSSRYKTNANVNSYTLVKAIAEELRGLAVETNVQMFTATQINRQGFNNSDVDLTNTAESMGLPATADFFIAIIGTEELEELNQVMMKQLKNRLGDVGSNRKFVVGLDKSKMKFYDVSQTAQQSLVHVNGESGKVVAAGNDEDDDPYAKSLFRKSEQKFNQKFNDWG